MVSRRHYCIVQTIRSIETASVASLLLAPLLLDNMRVDAAMNHDDKSYEKLCKVGLVIGTVLNGTLALWMYQAPWVANDFRRAVLTTLSAVSWF
jgi:hypothetical protein